jgi:ParB family chromosome partitioning protein
MKAANGASTHHLDVPEALSLSRQMWGNSQDHYRTIGSGENEWYTPAEYIEKARRVLGTIDLDPASCDEANKTVKATEYFTEEVDGLSQEWHGNVWLNPPYSRDLMPAFVEKLKASVCHGDVGAAIMVSHNNTDTGWFHNIAPVCTSICFPKTRIKFYRGDEIAAPTNGQIFVYFGLEVIKFETEFSDVGFVMVPA